MLRERRGSSGGADLRRAAARASFSGLGHEKLRELWLRGRVRFLPVLRLGLGFGSRAAVRKCTTRLARTGLWGWGLYQNLTRKRAKGRGRQRGRTRRGLRHTLQTFSFCFRHELECRCICGGGRLEGVGPTTLSTCTVLTTRVLSRGARQWGGTNRHRLAHCACRSVPFAPKKIAWGCGFEEVPLRPVGSAPSVCATGPFTRLFHNLKRGELPGLVRGKTLCAEYSTAPML